MIKKGCKKLASYLNKNLKEINYFANLLNKWLLDYQKNYNILFKLFKLLINNNDIIILDILFLLNL